MSRLLWLKLALCLFAVVGLPGARAQERIVGVEAAWAERFGAKIAGKRQRWVLYPTLSGGERQRIQLARVLAISVEGVGGFGPLFFRGCGIIRALQKLGGVLCNACYLLCLP